MRTLGKIFTYVGLCLLAFFLLAICSVLLFEQTIPRSVLEEVVSRLSSSDIVVSVESASFRFWHGVKLRRLRIFDRRRPASDPVFSADLVDVELNLRRLPWRPSTLVRAVTVTGCRYPRLPEGYYTPDSIEFPGQPDFKEKDEPVRLDLPDIRPFRLTLVRPDILSVTPKLVECRRVSCRANIFQAEGLHLLWADSDAAMTLDGGVALDLDAQQVRGEVRGLARQHNIRPMLVALDITNSYPFIDAFTKVEKPIETVCRFDVNLRNNDLHLFLDLKPEGGCYNAVPLARVSGSLDINVFVRDTFQNARITVGPLDVRLADGRAMEGTVLYENTNDVGFVTFDVRSTTTLSNALAIADVMRDGTLDCLAPETPPTVTLRGRMAVDPRDAATNHLDGTVAFDRGTFFSVPLRSAFADFKVRGTDVFFGNARAAAPHGGRITGEGLISSPEFNRESASFSVRLKGADLSLRDLADVFKFDLGDKQGTVFCDVALSGPLSSNAVARFNGHGHISGKNQHLAGQKVFAGLGSYLAKDIPFLEKPEQTSCGSLDFTLSNGVFRTSNLVIEGGPLSTIQAEGSYDIPNDRLDFSVRLLVKVNESLFRLLSAPVTWTAGKMLVRYTVTGSIDDPKWAYDTRFIKDLKNIKREKE